MLVFSEIRLSHGPNDADDSEGLDISFMLSALEQSLAKGVALRPITSCKIIVDDADAFVSPRIVVFKKSPFQQTNAKGVKIIASDTLREVTGSRSEASES